MATSVSLPADRAVLVALAGFGAGVFNGVAGGGTLIAFPVLLAFGYPALTANVTTTVGIWPGYMGGMAGFRSEIVSQRAMVWRLAPVAVAGAVVGAVLLLTTPSSDFADLAPWLVLLAAALFAAQPLLVRLLGPAPHHHRTRRVPLLAGTFVISIYGAYFGGAMGIMLLAVFGLALPDSLARISGLRTVLSVMVNGVAALVFVVHAHLVWGAVAALAAGSLVGGWAGARLARRMPAPVLRALVVAIGVATTVKLVVG